MEEPTEEELEEIQTKSEEFVDVYLEDANGKSFKISAILATLLAKVKQRIIKRDMDWVAIIDGREGSGKSVFAQQIAKALDPTFNINRVCFSANEFIHAIKIAEKFQAIILDEAYASINARASLSETNRALISTATQMRQKNLFVLICLPSIFDLDRYFALWRTSCLFHVYFNQDYKRGQAIIFPFNSKKLLYLFGKKAYSYSFPKSPYPPIHFLNHYVVNEEEYRKKKALCFGESIDEISDFLARPKIWLAQRNALVCHLLKNISRDQSALEAINRIMIEYDAPIFSTNSLTQIKLKMKKIGKL